MTYTEAVAEAVKGKRISLPQWGTKFVVYRDVPGIGPSLCFGHMKQGSLCTGFVAFDKEKESTQWQAR